MRFSDFSKFLMLVMFGTLFANSAISQTVAGTVFDNDGNLLEHAVISLVGENEALVNENTVMQPPKMTQKDIQFTPFVLPVAAGTRVSFPNKDKVRHHVYSFSKIKRFELELYGEDVEKSVIFDQEGVVALGCNIHDNMLAYIYVARSNRFAKTSENGTATIENLVPGVYSAYVWHPRLSGDEEDLVQQITVDERGITEINFEISLKRERNRRRSTY